MHRRHAFGISWGMAGEAGYSKRSLVDKLDMLRVWWPKKASGVLTDVTEDVVRHFGMAAPCLGSSGR